jgi:hypothetical protein
MARRAGPRPCANAPADTSPASALASASSVKLRPTTLAFFSVICWRSESRSMREITAPWIESGTAKAASALSSQRAWPDSTRTMPASTRAPALARGRLGTDQVQHALPALRLRTRRLEPEQRVEGRAQRPPGAGVVEPLAVAPGQHEPGAPNLLCEGFGEMIPATCRYRARPRAARRGCAAARPSAVAGSRRAGACGD